jgi:hypothetical protein
MEPVDGDAAHAMAIGLLTVVSELVRITSPVPEGPQPPDPLEYAQKCVLLLDQKTRQVGALLGMTPDDKATLQ